MKELSGKTAVVTGAASGLGLAFSESFTALGMNVVMADVEAGPLAVEAERLGRTADVLPLTVDVSSVDAIEQMHAATIERFGTAHVLCNNAGVGGGGNVADTSIEMWEWVLGVDLWGVIYGCKTFLPGMLAQGEGHIINTASIAGQLCFSNMASYNVAKFGVVALSETIADETVGTGVNVSCLCPGFVATKIADSSRNLPENMAVLQPEPTEEEEAIRQMVLEAFSHQKPPAEVAQLVVDAIISEQFWIMTDDVFQPRMAARHAGILAAKNRPQLGGLWEVFNE
ncbi:MAG: SDR family NAD(P)-dependent oxidoreductase [Acidimicrobiales bacterium]|nr:SDR family NAD(P)-dependent oxidoreductase [Acidimicrobiales bacterium]MDG2218106.1 SDR family NAD(P)-dependent oxidoreductase [Acidimicrobiales bacterium]